jgi:hypothetical protein
MRRAHMWTEAMKGGPIMANRISLSGRVLIEVAPYGSEDSTCTQNVGAALDGHWCPVSWRSPSMERGSGRRVGCAIRSVHIAVTIP